VFDPEFGARVTSDERTPLHLAAKYSNSVAVIQELIRVYPAALEMRDIYQNTPLSCCLQNTNPEAPDILQALIDAALHTASLLYVFNETSIFQVLRIHSNNLINGIKDESKDGIHYLESFSWRCVHP
jgi:ankyrin repeat protein